MTDQLGIDFDASTRSAREGEDLTHEEWHVLSLLEEGKDNAHSVRWLAGMVGVSQVRLREIVRHLIDVHAQCIGSSTSNPPGYYIAVTPEEIDEVCGKLRHRGISILMRAAALSKTSVVEVFGQGEL